MPFTKFTPAVLLLFAGLAAIIATCPAQAQTETVLYNFTGGSNGANPSSRLIADGAGNFYGTTNYGGLGFGVVFELSPNDNGGWNETVLHTFTNGADGAYPNNSTVIFDSAGNLYGTASGGGAHGYGVVFKLSPAGKHWNEMTLYNFANGTDSGCPANGMILDSAGNFYGTTACGVTSGAVFELSPSGRKWKERVIYSIDFPYPNITGLTMDSSGNIFGVGYASVFELSPNGNGGWNPFVLYNFTGYVSPTGPVVFDHVGNLYGTTAGGQGKNFGWVYKLSPRKYGKWSKTILYSFLGGTDGRGPLAGIVFDSAGNIYGTTYSGGADNYYGTVFELVAQANGGYTHKILWSFNSGDGDSPYSSLILDSTGSLYGTTVLGGSGQYGVVFKVTP
jgi:uncharacterized repeat protein (TIGR03803 family)